MMKKTNDNPMISVIVPVYNVEPHIARCIESIVNQTYKNLEIILVDDGSTDASGKICDEYAKNDNRIRVVHKQNGGLVSARKTGIAEASGIYAAYVDGDDWIEKNMYEELQEQIKDADVIISGTYRDYGKISTREVNKISDGIYEGKDRRIIYQNMIYTGRFYERGIQSHLINCLYKRELVLKNQMSVPNEIRVSEDDACLYPLLLNACKIILTSRCYYHYVMRENSIMGINDGNELMRYKIVYAYLKSRFAQYRCMEENLMWQLRNKMIYDLLLKEVSLLQSDRNFIFPYKGLKNENSVIVYGKGRFGKEFVNYLRRSNLLNIILWTDSSEIDKNRRYILNEDYNYIIIAVLMKDIADEIKRDLEDMGVDREKIKCIDENEIRWAVDRIEETLG